MGLEVIDVTRHDQERPRRRRTSASQQVSRSRQREMLRRKRLIRRRRKILIFKLVLLACMVSLIVFLGFMVRRIYTASAQTGSVNTPFVAAKNVDIADNKSERPRITEDFLTVNPYSRPGDSLPEVKNIFIHYTANKGTSAAQNKSYFENLGLTGETSASAHFVIGFDGEIIQCIPLDEIGYAVKTRNYDSISIECCYLDDNGKFTEKTYQSLLQLCGWLLREYRLSPEDVLRHYDEGGKKCPLYYVEHEDAWQTFLEDLGKYIS